jgi:hypothetical protein
MPLKAETRAKEKTVIMSIATIIIQIFKTFFIEVLSVFEE